MSLEAWAHLPWAIVGAGRVGQMIGLMGQRCGAQLELVWSRSAQGAKGAHATLGVPVLSSPLETLAHRLRALGPCVVWCTVSDAAIAPVASSLMAGLLPGSILLHTSGALSSAVLPSVSGVACASVHPLLSVVHPEAAMEAASGCTWTIEGDVVALDFATAFLNANQITPRHITPDGKTLYHASAVTAAGLLVSLLDAAFEMCAHAGIDDPAEVLLPLARSCLNNLDARSTQQAITGPVARGDDATVSRHMEALAALGDPQLLEVYALLTQRARDITARSK